MKLNPDCIRDILLWAESEITFLHSAYYEKDLPNNFLEQYTHDEIIYHIRQASQANLISISSFYEAGDSVHILDLTPDGHTFLANVREKDSWKRAKDICKNLGYLSLNSLVQVAGRLAAKAIDSLFL